MARLDECIQTAMDAGEIPREQGRAAQDAFRNRFDFHRRTNVPEADAARMAAEDVRAAAKAQTAAKARMVVAQLDAMRRMKSDLTATAAPGRGLKLMMEFDDGAHSLNWTGESAQSLATGLIRIINGKINATLREIGPKLTGKSRSPALMDDWVMELHGEDSGNAAAKAIAKPVMEAREELRQMHNAFGGDIGKLADHGLPHTHHAGKIREAGFEAWRNEISGRLAWHRIIDNETGKTFVAEAGARPNRAAADAFLKRVYQNISTDGWNTREPSLRPAGRALYAQRDEHRLLHFASARDWVAYNKRFGASDPFTAMINQLHGMAKEIALMRRFGPNPRAGMEYAIQIETQRAALSLNEDLKSKVRNQGELLRTMMFHADGSANAPVDAYWASFFGGTRAVLTSAQLGSSVLSSTTDIATIRAGAKMLGMNPNNVISRMTRIAAGQDRETLAAAGYVFDSLADAGAAHSRYFGEFVGPEFARLLSSATMRLSGQTYWTDMTRLAFIGEFTSKLALESKKALDAVDPLMARVLKARGIGEAEWDMFRNDAAGLFRPKEDASFLSPAYWLEHQTSMPRDQAQDLAFRMQMLIEEQLEIAIPNASLEGRARTLGRTRSGTITGELLRSVAMYKGFTLSFTLNQIRRFNNLPEGVNRWGYAARLAAGLIVLGGVAIQLKELAKGRDPRPLDATFLAAAIFQSGGLGIFGDFFSSETSRAGGGLAETIAGPVVGAASDVIGIGARGISSLWTGDNFRPGREVVNLLRYNTPIASSLWYARAGFERMVIDQLQWLLDPDAQDYFKSRTQRLTQANGNEPYYPPGQMLPERLPNMMAMFGAGK